MGESPDGDITYYFLIQFISKCVCLLNLEEMLYHHDYIIVLLSKNLAIECLVGTEFGCDENGSLAISQKQAP